MANGERALWKEFSVAVYRSSNGNAGPGIIFQGPLDAAIDYIRTDWTGDLSRLKISFPDRGVAPFQVQHGDIYSLIAERKAADAAAPAGSPT